MKCVRRAGVAVTAPGTSPRIDAINEAGVLRVTNGVAHAHVQLL